LQRATESKGPTVDLTRGGGGGDRRSRPKAVEPAVWKRGGAGLGEETKGTKKSDEPPRGPPLGKRQVIGPRSGTPETEVGSRKKSWGVVNNTKGFDIGGTGHGVVPRRVKWGKVLIVKKGGKGFGGGFSNADV